MSQSTDENNIQQGWLQLTLAAREHTPEQLEDALLAAGAIAVTLRDGGDQPVLEPAPGETPLWPETLVTGLFDVQTDIEAVKVNLCQQLGTAVLHETCLETLTERDWVRAWLDNFHPMRFGRRLWVCPSATAPPQPDAVNLLLDPGLAFGTGTHPTTALCLEWLDAAELNNKRVIDYGCGSGILAIAAARLGAKQVWAVDIDPQALLATRENAARNQVAEQIQLGAPATLSDVSSPLQVDVVLANILAGPLIVLAPLLAGFIRSGGAVVLAGLISDQVQDVQQAYAPWFDFQANRQRENWVLLHGVKR
ncbi:MAG: 50S ribosomal protein L11 methyltransferase [Candidatus Competibacteraceae bacterium]|nr:50S ribosomal protein L11 methyltransferase [Candidatus Competibacteraceae bacterium]MCB1807052.1 50S ribosomal protein L11 methyltransferase [Candidatus Competibacteraceae bacterium]